MTTTKISAAEQATIDQIKAFQSRAASVNTAPPAGFEATCPKCGGASRKTLVARFGHCMACQRAAQNV